MADLGKCQVEGCTKEAKCQIHETIPDRTNPWLHVCQEHFEEILDKNLERFHEKRPRNIELIGGG